MSGMQLSGLVSGFDWKSFVDQLITYERAPAGRMQTEIANNQLKLTSLGGVESRINDLRAAVKGLDSDQLFHARSASAATSGWSAQAGASAAPGTYAFELTRAATASRWIGGADIGLPLAPSADVSGLTLASLGTATRPTAGVFTVNGARITVGLADSLEEVFERISTATGGAVTASYVPGADRVRLESAGGPVVLGSATDTSNFLSALRLSNNGSAQIESAAALGAASPSATLAQARLARPVTSVNEDGSGTFAINGTQIAYNLLTDSLSTLLARINASGAGVTASFDPVADRVSLLNNSTGDLGVSIEEPEGGLLAALGLTASAGAVLSRGQDTEFTVNGGTVLRSASNTLDESAHAIAGLVVTPAATGGASLVTVGRDTATLRSRIDAFVSAFNSLQSYIESQTRVTSANGKVTSATLGDNREVQKWGDQLRAAAFNAVPGLEGAIARLDHLGIDFNGSSSTLAVKDPAKLEAALREKPDQVQALFRQAGTGLAARFQSLFASYVGPFGGAGLLGGQRAQLTNGNTSLTQQIADLDRRLVQRRAQLESGFIAMERAQATIQQMQSQLTRAFPMNSSKS
jgi:flagellar hook-associated protein 2